jgi:hypothetical protein
MSSNLGSPPLSFSVKLLLGQYYGQFWRSFCQPAADQVEAGLRVHIKILLQRRSLNHRYDVEDILYEVIGRVFDVVMRGREINSHLAYSKKVAESVIFKLLDDEIKQRGVTALLANQQINGARLLVDEYEDILIESLNRLKQKDQESFELIEKFYLENQSWKKITERIYGDNYEDSDYDCIRQKGNRSKNRLKTIFHEILAQRIVF